MGMDEVRGVVIECWWGWREGEGVSVSVARVCHSSNC